MTYRRFSSHSKLGPPTETTGEGYAAFKKKLEELKRIAPLPDPQAEIIAQETREDALGRENPPEIGHCGGDYLDRIPGAPKTESIKNNTHDEDIAAGIFGMNDGGYDGD